MNQLEQSAIPLTDEFKLIANSVPAMIWSAGADKARNFFNTSWLHFTGQTVQQKQIDHWTRNVHPDDLDDLLNNFNTAFERRSEFKTQYRLLRNDGVYRKIQDNSVPHYTSDGSFAGYIGNCTDIEELQVTKRIKEEPIDTEALQKGQAMLAAIIESSEDAIISKTLQGMITSWNKAAERVFGYSEHETLGKHISLIIPNERLSEEDIIIGKIRNNESLEHFETIRLTKYGKLIPISLTVSPIRDRNGQVIGASKIARDISRTKEAEEKLQNYAEKMEILNTIGQVISADLDAQAILQKVTDATTQLTGAAFGAFFHKVVNENGESYMLYSLSGAPRNAFDKFGMPRNTQIFDNTFSGKGIVRSDDITQDPRYGHNHPYHGIPEGHPPVISYLAVPVISKTGNVLGGLFFGHAEAGKFTKEHENLVAGIAAQAASALDNAKLYEEVKQLNAKKDEFIGMASHELKTPVTSVKGYLQIIERDHQMESRTRQFVSKALQQVNKLSSLVSDLLDVSKIQSGKLPFSYSSFDVNLLLKDVGEMIEQSNPTYQIEYNLAPAEINMEADQQRIEQVIINLISNAIKYSPNSKRVIIGSVDLHDKVQVSVQDFGIGIEKNHLDRIFSRFYRVENLASHMSGLGIGLYISQEIIKRHKGQLWVNSTPGEGSTFFFEIPKSKHGK
ncbi:MAG: PAS domain S-box protein [Mucilaginibacter sp.]